MSFPCVPELHLRAVRTCLSTQSRHSSHGHLGNENMSHWVAWCKPSKWLRPRGNGEPKCLDMRIPEVHAVTELDRSGMSATSDQLNSITNSDQLNSITICSVALPHSYRPKLSPATHKKHNWMRRLFWCQMHRKLLKWQVHWSLPPSPEVFFYF